MRKVVTGMSGDRNVLRFPIETSTRAARLNLITLSPSSSITINTFYSIVRLNCEYLRSLQLAGCVEVLQSLFRPCGHGLLALPHPYPRIVVLFVRWRN